MPSKTNHSTNEQSPDAPDTTKVSSPLGDTAPVPLPSEQSPTLPKSSDSNSAYVPAIDPVKAFRRKIERERREAMDQESFLNEQMAILDQKLLSVRTVIEACDQALTRTNGAFDAPTQ